MSPRQLTTVRIFGISLVGMLVCQQSFAQLVEVGPGYVKAPFVRIYTDPDGGTHVRAPFTHVYTPGYRNFVPPDGFPLGLGPPPRLRRFESQRPATADPFELRPGEMSWQNLRQVAREGVAELNQELQRYSATESWQDYLQTDALAALVADEGNAPPDENTRQELREILRTFDATTNSSYLSSIHGQPGFRKVHAALRELVVTPRSRQRRLVAASVRNLRRELSTLGSKGESWAAHLKLSSRILQDDAYDPGSVPADTEVEQLDEIISRFDAVSLDPRYTLIAGLAGFQALHENLIVYRDMGPQELDGRVESDDQGGDMEPKDMEPKDVGGIEPVPLPIEELPPPPAGVQE